MSQQRNNELVLTDRLGLAGGMILCGICYGTLVGLGIIFLSAVAIVVGGIV